LIIIQSPLAITWLIKPVLYAFMYDCTNKGPHSPVSGQRKYAGGIGGIAFALPPFHLYCSKARV